MTVDRWLTAAAADVRARGLEGVLPVLEAFARSMETLRAADWSSGPPSPRGDGERQEPAAHAGSPAAREPTARPGERLDSAVEPHALDLREASERIRRRSLTSLALTESCLGRVERLDGSLNAFITVTRDEALAAAREADAELARGEWRGPLHGIPVSLKDLIDQRGIVTTAGSRAIDPVAALADAPVTAALRHAGAVLVGKTNLHEFAFGTTSEESAFGAVRHPLDSDRSPGGSSGGSAVAVLTGMSLASLGTDTGGSIRIPSAACGIVGLKPGAGELTCAGVVPLSWTLDHVGPLARTVGDAAIVYRVLAGLPSEPPGPRPAVAGLRVGVLRDYFEDVLEPGVRDALARVQQRLRTDGAVLVDVQLPHAGAIAAIYLGIVFAEAAAFHAGPLESRAEQYQPGVRLRLEAARYVLAEDYVRALQGRTVIRADVDRALENCDVLLAATLPIEAPLLGARTITVDGTAHAIRTLMLRLTQPFNISGHPAISMPCGRTASGLPCGMQLVGRRGGTLALLEAARGCELYGAEGLKG